MTTSRIALAALIALGGTAAAAQGELNLYSSRHYDSDEQLYSAFEEQTGVTINRIEADADELIARLEAEGANSPADVLITVDAGRAWRAEQTGLLGSVDSETLERRIPDYLQHPENKWFSMAQRSRIIFYNKDMVEEPPQTYADLADPKYKDMICTRSSSNIYMLSLLASIIEHEGEEAAKEWAQGLRDNLARDPQGGDTDQLRAIVSGECPIAVANTYYFARALEGGVDGLSGETDKVGWVFPNQSDRGAHMNVSVAAVLESAPNRENAVKFLEYLTSDTAQRYFSEGSDEYPAVPGTALSEPLAQLGLFRQDDLNLSALGQNQTTATRIYDEVGYE